MWEGAIGESVCGDAGKGHTSSFPVLQITHLPIDFTTLCAADPLSLASRQIALVHDYLTVSIHMAYVDAESMTEDVSSRSSV